MDSKKRLHKSISFWIMVLLLLYSTLGFFTVPLYLKKEFVKLAKTQFNSELTVADINFNPFTIAIDIKQLSLTDIDGTKWFSSDSVHTNVNLLSSLVDSISIQSIQLNNPYFLLKTQQVADEISLKYPTIIETDQPQNTEQSAFVIDIEDININQGSVFYADGSSEKTLNLNIADISFQHQGFTTKDRQSDFQLAFSTDDQAKIKLVGKINLAADKLDANWQIDGLTSASVFNFIGDKDNAFFGLHNESGSISANGRVKLQSIENLQANIEISQLLLENFSTSDSGARLPIIKLPVLKIEAMSIDLAQQSLEASTIDIKGSDYRLYFDDDQQLILPALTDTEQSNSHDNNEQNWNYKINTINIIDGILHVNKGIENSENNIDLTAITINNLSNNTQQPTEAELLMSINNKGAVHVAAQMTSKPLLIKSNVNIENMQLPAWQNWIPDTINLTVEQGLIAIDQDITISANNILSKGSLSIQQLKLLDPDKQPFLSLNQLELTEMSIDSAQKTIVLNRLKLDQAQGSLSISNQQQLNIGEIIEAPEEPDEEDKNTDDWKIEIKQIEFIDSQTQFIDKSIKPNYQTELSQLNGSIKGLSSTNLSKANVDLTGVLDTYGNISITGQINPLSEQAYTDLAINIKNVDLQNFSSYSGRYLGFPIERGKADFTLNYKLNQSLLKGVNDLTFKQLQFGSKTNSEEAISLPLKLAVTLLTDGKGIMKINLPVSGNIDDPEFSYGGLVFKAFFKLITGIVASPFKLLGKLVPGGADLDLSGIQFKAGTLELNTEEEPKLKALAAIINKRPSILLELTGVANTIEDGKALRLLSLKNKVGISQAPQFDTVSSQAKIKAHYIETFSEQKWLTLVNNTTLEGQLDPLLLSENAWSELLETQEITAELDLLAKQRGQIIHGQLIENYSIPQDRIFLKPPEQSQQLFPQVKFGVTH